MTQKLQNIQLLRDSEIIPTEKVFEKMHLVKRLMLFTKN